MKTILVGLDGSPRAALVLQQAADLARRTGAKMVLYRAVGIPAELPTLALSKSPGELAVLLQELAKQSLEELATSLEPGLVTDTRVSLAIPWQGVCEAARDAHADLVVVGAHGYGGLDRVLGTTAAKIVNHCAVSVLVVKANP
jgi:universal stress protein F